jgi:hypothetical protein
MSQRSLDSTAVGRRMRALLETPLLGPSREDLRVRHNWSSADIDPETAVPNILLLPNIWIVTLLLGAFVVIVGPVNFYLLRRRRRLEMAWFTIPALSMGFFVAVYGYGMATKGGDQAYASAEILHLISGESRGLLLWNSMQFSPRRTTYAFDSPPGGTSMPLLTYFHGPNASLLPGGRGAVTAQLAPGETTRASRLLPDAAHGYRLFQPGEQWKMHFYQGERTMRIEGSIRGKATIAGGGSSLELDVTNDTAATLEDARFYLGEEEYRLGRIEPGERLRHEFVGANRRLDRGEPEKPVDRFVELAHQRIRDGARGAYPIFPVQLPQRRCRLVAVQEVWGSEVELSPDPDHYKQCRLVEVELPLELLGAATLQTQTILRRDLYNMEPDGGLSPNGDYVNLNQSLADVAISPPLLEGPVRFESGRIEIDYSARGIEYFEASAFNYATGRWETFHRSLSGSRNSPPGGRLGESESIAQRRTNPFGGISQGEASRVKAEVRRDWINPSEPLLRLRLEARRINDPSLGARVGLNGVDVHRVDAALTLSPEAAPRPRGEDRR